MHAAFSYDLPRYLAFGGYPGAVALEHDPDPDCWYACMNDAIVEAVIGKDILQSPKMLPACPVLYSMVAGVDVMRNTEQRGRAFELGVGAELMQLPGQVFYWRERNDEVDFVYQYRERLYAIEVKSGRKKLARGLDAFCAQEPKALRVIVTPENFALFFAEPRDFLQLVAI